MRLSRGSVLAGATLITACTSATTNVRQPIEARLLPGARTGAPIPLHVDPNAEADSLRSQLVLQQASFLASRATRRPRSTRRLQARVPATGRPGVRRIVKW